MQRLETEWEPLEQEFRMLLQHDPNNRIEFEGTALTDKATIESVLGVMERKLQTGQRPVLGSLLIKYYGRMLCGALYAMSRLQQGLDVSLGSIRLAFNDQLEPSVSLTRFNPVPAPVHGREAWRAEIVKSMFADNLQPMIQRVFMTAHLSPCVLWENVVIYIHHFYKRWMNEAATEEESLRIKDDYLFVTQYAGCELFGECTENPLNIPGSCMNHPLQEGETIRVRKTCCLRYNLPDGRSCTTCPRLNDEQRKERFTEAYASK